MRYKKFGTLDFEISALGQGAMRLPTKDGSYTEEAKADFIRLIRHAVDSGINYLDTAFNYHNSEELLGLALKDGYRERVCLVTKSPVWLVNTSEDFDCYLDKQMERLQTSYLDVYMLHGLTKKHWEKCQELGAIEFLERAKLGGKIKHIGFSFHDSTEVFKEIVDAYNWDMCLIQLNYINESFQAGIEGLRYAGAKGIPVMIMEPLLGGRLAKNVPAEVLDLWNKSEVKRTPAEWGLSYLYNQPEVFTVLSGMSTMEEMNENIATAGRASVGMLTAQDHEIIGQVREWYLSKILVQCTECNYCHPCPVSIPISGILKLYNAVSMQFSTADKVKAIYKQVMERKTDVSQCTSCGNCESICPQGLSILQTLKEFHQQYAE